MALASLPMYALPEVAGARADYWRGLARAFRRAGIAEVPDRLADPADLDRHWLARDLLFSQTCGYPLTHALAGQVELVATPCYMAPGCEGPNYRSLIVVRVDLRAAGFAELRGRVAAVNTLDSQSGCNVLRALAAPHHEGGRFFGRVVVTGGHLKSIAAVAAGAADVAAVDCVTLALVARHRPRTLAGLRVLCEGPPAPGLPYITAGGADRSLIGRLREGLAAAQDDPHLAAARDALLLAGVAVLAPDDYDCIGEMERAAAARGYPRVA